MIIQKHKTDNTNTADIKQIARRWFQLIGEHNIEEICNITSPSWVMHGGPKGLSAGHAGVHELFNIIGPVQQQWTIEDMIVEGDKVVVRAINTCIQEFFFGLPAYGRTQIFSAIFIHRIQDGKIAETWRNADDLGRLFQLGVRIRKPGSPVYHPLIWHRHFNSWISSGWRLGGVKKKF